MTNEEAIKFLSQIRDALLASNSWLPSTHNPIKESFGMAINALTAQESCNQLATNLQPCKQDADDTISRQAVLDALTHEWDGMVTSVFDVVKSLPSTQADSKETSSTHKTLDTISRQAAIDAHYEYCNKHPDVGFPVWSLKILENLPSAQPERETAKFIRWMECKKTDEYISYTPHCKCSKCGTEFLIHTIKYCYVCGARMEENNEANRCGCTDCRY